MHPYGARVAHYKCEQSLSCRGASELRPCVQHKRARSSIIIPTAVPRTAYSYETKRLTKCLLTRQALKTMLNYLSETNGEMHFFLHDYVASNPLPLDGRVDADEWIVQLASTPLTQIQDPRGSSVVTVATVEAALNGQREVSPREIAERLMGLREHIAKEMVEDLQCVADDNKQINRRTLEKTFKELDFGEP